MMLPVIEDPYKYKLIYVVRARNDSHKGLLKIGDATLTCSLPRDAVEAAYPPDCPGLNAAAEARVREYMRTAGLEWQVLHTELALSGKGGGFRDHAVHNILRRSGFPKEDMGESGAREWFRVTLPVALAAIRAAREGRAALSAKESNPTFVPMALWPNQREAVELAKARFEAGAPAVLWNAKMRFGKTLSAMTLIKEAGYRRVLICTHRPVVRKGWREEYVTVFGDADTYRFVDDEEGLRRERGNCIYFASIQDLRGSQAVSGKYAKNATIVSAQAPFGFDIRQAGSMRRQKHDFALRPDQTRNIVFYYNGWRKEGKGYVARTQVKAHQEWMDCIKVFLPKVWGTGDPRTSRIPAFVVEPPSVCTETYLTLTPFATRQEAENALRYIETKFFHFLVGIRKTSQNGAKGVYRFVPLQDFTRAWTDAGLYAKYGLTAEESAFIEQTIPDASAARPSRERRP